MLITSKQQVDIFSEDHRQLHFAELCNALYERELASLSQLPMANISLLQRKLAGLRHHVKRTAYSLLQHSSPLTVDIHNASWQAKQAAKCMAHHYDLIKTQNWFSQDIQIGSAIAIHVQSLGFEHIELDSIDKLALSDQRLHANKFGWFNITGCPIQEDLTDPQAITVRLLKPTKAIFSAGCCGHSWTHKGKGHNRALSLRELRLSLSIDWKTFR
jgi:hypothetical protein